MIKYEITRYKFDGFSGVTTERKSIKKSKLSKYLNDDWILVRKRYFIITHFLDFWRSLNTDQKINIIIFTIGTIITTALAVIGWIYFID